MSKIALIGVGLWMIGDGIPAINSVGGVLKVAGGVLFLVTAFL